MRSLLALLKDSELVWRFQHLFGVRKVEVIEAVGEGHGWVVREKSRSLQSQAVRQEDKEDKEKAPDWDTSKDGSKARLRQKDTGDESVNSSGYGSEGGRDGPNIIVYEITNYFWYLLFRLGSQLGDETFYAFFFSFWFWNIDGAVGRRVILVWNLVMYIGQGMKDIIRWPRPAMPPVVQLETKWALEYGMPSTHAMIGLSVPASVIIFTINRYQYPFLLWVAIASFWCVLVCSSRLYLGMHSLADIVAGLIFAILLLFIVLPIVHYGDYFLLSSPLAPSVTVTLSVLAIWFYPGSDKWTPARGESTVVLGSYLGTQLGNWLNFQVGIIQGVPVPPPYPILWPTFHQYGQTLLRVVIGGVIGVATRAVFKPVSYLTACYLLETDTHTLKHQEFHVRNRKKLAADLFYKFLTYTAIGFNVCFVAPVVFRVLGCERPSFYTEL